MIHMSVATSLVVLIGLREFFLCEDFVSDLVYLYIHIYMQVQRC